MQDTYTDQIFQVFNSIAEIPIEEWNYAQQYISIEKFRKHAYLIHAGDIASHSFLILEGIVRVYYTTEQGREFNKGFAGKNEFVGSVSSVIGNIPSRFSIQALADTTAALLPRSSIERMYDRHRCWDRFGRIVAERSLIAIEKREGEILDTLEEQYLHLLKSQPEISAKIPQYHIASYLGITDVALSRLKGRMKKKGLL